jgi:hypothetical protein
MAREITEREIDGETYEFYQLGAIKSHNLLRKIGAIVAPVLGALAGNKDGGKSVLDAEIDLESVLNSLFEKATEAEVESIIVSLLSQVHHNGTGHLKNKDVIDQHFKGRLGHMYKVVYAAFEEEYSDFFGEGGMFANISHRLKVLTPAK